MESRLGLVNEIQVSKERQRKTFAEESIRELAQSIAKPIGLLQPIVLRNDGRTLVCGERRLRAISMLHESDIPFSHNGSKVAIGYVPFVVLKDLDEDQLKEAELEENVQRQDLSWQERARAIADLHELRQSQGETRGAQATAEEVFGDNPSGPKRQEVYDALDLVQYLDDPLVAAAPDAKTARKAVKESAIWAERARRSDSYNPEDSPHRLWGSDCIADLSSGNYSNCFDVIVIDPPYGIDIHKKEMFDGDKHGYDDSDQYFTEVILEKLPSLAGAAAKSDAHLYCFCDIRRFTELFVAFELGGWLCWPRPLIWDKGNTGSYGDHRFGFRACYDAILFARKGNKGFEKLHRDVINITQSTRSEHPAGKPVELFSELLGRSALPGDTVADFFCGSGPVFPAASEHQCIAYGWENNEKYYQLALEALEAAS